VSQSGGLRRDVLNRIGAGVAIVDPDTRIIEWVNPTAADLFGASAELLVGQPCHRFLCPTDAGDCVDNGECVLLRHDGSELPVMRSAKRILIEGKEKLVETFVDLSGRDQAEATRRESEDRYRALFETSQDAMMILAPPTWNFVAANAATLQLFGVEDEATFTALTPWALSPATQPDGRPSAEKAREMIQIARRDGSHCFEWRHRGLDGREIPASVQLTLLEFEGHSLVQATVRDMSSTELALSALRHSEARLRLAIEATGMGTYHWDHATGKATYSPEFLALYDLPPDGTLPLGPDLVPLAVLDEDRPALLAAMVAGNDPRGDGVMQAEFRIRRPDGSIRWVMSRGRTEFMGTPETLRPSQAAGMLMDITERKRGEEALRASEELHRTILHTAMDGLVLMDTEGRILEVNEAYCRMTGYGKQELIGSHVPDLEANESSVEVARRLRNIITRGEDRFESRHRRKDGTVFDVETCVQYRAVQGGRLVAFLRDISQRKRADQEIALLKHSIDVHFDAAYWTDSEDKIIYLNEAGYKALGFDADELLGKTLAAVNPKATTEAMTRVWDKLRAEGFYSSETVHRRKDGSEFPAEIHTSYVRFGGKEYTCGFARDITTRRQAEAALRESEERFRASFMTGLDAVFWATLPDGRVLEVNRVFESLYGYSREEVIGHTAAQLGLYCDPDDRSRMLAELGEKGFVRDLELKARRKDGHIITVSFSASLVRSSNRPFFLGMVRDISERKRAEEETAKLTMQLQQAQKMESVGRLAGGVAHDFNNMLGVILGHSELALERLDASDPLHNDLATIRTAAQRSADLTRQLLAFARKQTLAPRVLNLNDTVAGMLKMVRRLIGEDVHLQWRPGQSLRPVRIDPTQIDQILANLCVNARDAIANVGTITIETGNKVILANDATASNGMAPGDYVWMTVSDDGCGMTPGTLAHVFEPFFTTKDVGKGTGLGLATVYGIVKQNDGFIDLRSELGHGTTVTIYLPRHAGKEVDERTGAKPGIARPGRETVLLVEDEVPILEVTRRMLEKHGYRVLTASTPGRALELAREHLGDIDLLITDVVMPEMNGRDLAKSFLSIYPRAKRLFMSGYTADVIAHQGVLDEGVSFISKPFSAKDLAAQVRKVLHPDREIAPPPA
jgi:two-component system cell cycle sensor histidine kinase/response regulator CckA